MSVKSSFYLQLAIKGKNEVWNYQATDICLRSERARHHLVAAHGMDVFARACCSRISAKDSKTDEKVCPIAHKKPYLTPKKKRKSVVPNTKITPLVRFGSVQFLIGYIRTCTSSF
jgi:hypothetical protein